jgi:hypothetical protein
MSRYVPSRLCLRAAFALWALAAATGWLALYWPPLMAAAAPLVAASGAFVFLALRPPIEVREQCLLVGRRAIPWAEIRSVERVRWNPPLVVRLTLADRSRRLLIYPGDRSACGSLLRQIRRASREALIEGRPYREFWGEVESAALGRRRLSGPRYRLLRPEDEAEVEKMYQRLRTVGRIDSKSSSDET